MKLNKVEGTDLVPTSVIATTKQKNWGEWVGE